MSDVLKIIVLLCFFGIPRVCSHMEQQQKKKIEQMYNIKTYPNGYVPYSGNGRGYTRCRDGKISRSNGKGTCSHHGGISPFQH